jgi:hypothetical protein
MRNSFSVSLRYNLSCLVLNTPSLFSMSFLTAVDEPVHSFWNRAHIDQRSQHTCLVMESPWYDPTLAFASLSDSTHFVGFKDGL